MNRVNRTAVQKTFKVVSYLFLRGLFCALLGNTVCLSQTKQVGLVDIAGAAGSSLDQQLATSQSAFASVPSQYVVSAAGTFVNSVTLAQGNDLLIDANVQVNASISLTGNNKISCANGISITSSIPVFVVLDGASSVTVQGCTFIGQSNYLLSTVSGSASNISVLNNIASGGSLFLSYGNTVTNVLVQGNTVTYPSGVPGPAAHVYITGSWDNTRVLGNHFNGGTSGAEWLGAVAATYPDYAVITGGMNKNAIFSNNTCEGLQQTCAWGSGMWRTIFSGNSADGCSDLCYDFEGSADSTMTGNTCRNAGNGCASLAYFSGYNNSAIGNSFVSTNGEALIWTNNESRDAGKIQHISIIGNSLTCLVNCAAVRLAANVWVVIQGNVITDGRFDELPSSASEAGVIKGNTFRYTMAAQPGSGAVYRTGLNIPATYQSYFSVVDNEIITDVAQDAATYCMSVISGDTSAANVYTIDNNKCIGPWLNGIFLYGNSNPTAVFYVHSNLLQTLPAVTNAGTLYNFGNYTLSGFHD